MIYFTSDHHFYHGAIMKYCDRPFETIEEMNEYMVAEWNRRVTDKDTVYHLGDFSFLLQREVKNNLHGQVVFYQGNHDRKNWGLESGTLRTRGLTIAMRHRPPTEFLMLGEVPLSWADLYLCGHVHEKWKTKIINSKIIINVGVDVWDFAPVSIETIIKLYRRIQKEELESGTKPI